MKFKSRSALIEHIQSLEEDGYLESKWLSYPLENGNTRMQKVFKINFSSIPSNSEVTEK